MHTAIANNALLPILLLLLKLQHVSVKLLAYGASIYARVACLSCLDLPLALFYPFDLKSHRFAIV